MNNEFSRRKNKSGTVVFLGKGRYKPFSARLLVGKDMYGKPIYHDIATFEDKLAAIVFLENWTKDPKPIKIKKDKYNRIETFTCFQGTDTPYPLVPVKDMNCNINNEDKTLYTFSQVFEGMKKDLFPDEEEIILEKDKHIKPKDKYSYHNSRAMQSAYNKATELYDKIYSDIAQSDFKNCIKNLKTGASSKNTMLRLFSAMDKYAYSENIITKKSSMDIKYKETESTRTPFTYSQIEYLWNIKPTNKKEKFVRDILLLANYTGCRAEELFFIYTKNIHLEKDYFVAGLKTQAGRNREIPIHKSIKSIFAEYYNKDNEFLFMYNKKRKMQYSCYGYWFRSFIKNHPTLNGKTAHCGRHGVETELKKLNVKPVIINSILGHKNGNTADDIYTHISIEEKLEAINMIEYKDSKIYVLNDYKTS